MAELLTMLFVLILGAGVVLGLGVAVAALGSVIRGWVLSILWGWFMVPTFGLSVLGIVPAIGIMFTLTFMFQYSKISSDVSALKDKTSNKTKVVEAVVESSSPLQAALQREEQERQEKKEIRKKFGLLLFNLFVGPFFSLFFGWVIHLFM